MAKIDSNGYLERRTSGSHTGKNYVRSSVYRNWWLGKPIITLYNITIPKHLHGKRLRFKVEVVKETKQMDEVKNGRKEIT